MVSSRGRNYDGAGEVMRHHVNRVLTLDTNGHVLEHHLFEDRVHNRENPQGIPGGREYGKSRLEREDADKLIEEHESGRQVKAGKRSDTEQAFIDHLSANPTDAHTRNVYADYLNENGREHEAALHFALAAPHDEGKLADLKASLDRHGGHTEAAHTASLLAHAHTEQTLEDPDSVNGTPTHAHYEISDGALQHAGSALDADTKEGRVAHHGWASNYHEDAAVEHGVANFNDGDPKHLEAVAAHVRAYDLHNYAVKHLQRRRTSSGGTTKSLPETPNGESPARPSERLTLCFSQPSETLMATATELQEAKALAERLERSTSTLGTPASGSGSIESMLNNQMAPANVKALGAKPFSMHRFMNMLVEGDHSRAPHEVEVLGMYKKALEDTGCGLEGQLTGYWLPTNFDTHGGRLVASTKAENAINYVKAVFENTRPAYDPEEAQWLKRNRYVKADLAQSAYTDSLGGSLVAPPLQGDPIPFIRPQAAFLAAGVQAMTLPPNGRFVRPRITSAPTVVPLGESQTTPLSNLGTDQMTLTAKKISGGVILTEEGTAFTSGTLDNIAQGELGRSLGLLLDQLAFYGQGGTQVPAGLCSNDYAGQVTNIETSYGGIKGVGPNGNQLLPQYGDFFPTIIAEKSFNVDATTGCWVLRPGAYATAVGLRGDSVTANDQAGPMVDILRRFGESSPTMWRGRRVVQTTNIANARTKGNSGATLQDVFFGIWQYAIFASYGAIQFQQGHNANTFLKGQVIIRGTMFGDVGFEYPSGFLWYPNCLPLSNNF